MRVLITGGAGFIGSHLAETLLAAGRAVTALDDLSTGSIDNVRHLLERKDFELLRGSVCDADAVARAMRRCDAVFHLAAAVGVRLIAQRPVHTIQTNIRGSEVVLEQASRFGRRTFLASSSEVYGKSTRVPFAEDDDSLLGPTRCARWSYACSKMIDEFLALAYHRQHGLEVVIGRLFNTIGPRQSGQYGMVVPRFVRAALRGEALEVYGSGEQSRCFANVADVVGAIAALTECETALGEVVNIGGDRPITIADLAQTIVRMTGSASEIRRVSYEQAYGQPLEDMLIRRPSLEKIHRLIGYQPKYSLNETLEQIIEHQRGADG